jgi:putative membrane protein insertion efficiency factor
MKVLVKLIESYQNMPLASHSKCKFYPTCSNYAIEAINEYGNIKGSFLTFKRIIKCNPFNKKYGYDPVPQKEKKNEKI